MAFWSKKEGQTTDDKSPDSSSSRSSSSGSFNRLADKPGSDTVDSKERYKNVRSALGSGTVIQGKLSFDTPVRIDGKLSGEIFSTETLIVGPTGVIDAKIEVNSLIVMGKVKGELTINNKLEILKGGEVYADVLIKTIKVEEGSVFQGSCSMKSRDRKVVEVPSEASSKALAKSSTETAESNNNHETSVEAAVV